MAGEISPVVNEKTPQAEKTSETQTSASHEDDQTEVRMDIEDEQLVAKIEEKEKYKNKEDEDQSSSEKKKKFQKIMQENKDMEKYYRPREFSVGPNHADDKTDLSNKELKLKLTKKFINGSGKQANSLLCAIKKKIKFLKTFFGKEMLPLEGKYGSNDAELARLLFLDGCAVLQFIHSYVSDKLKEFEINNSQQALIRQDLFLFENQIPFAVLKLLMKSIGDEEKEGKWQWEDYSNLPYSFTIVKFVHWNNICDSTMYELFWDYFHRPIGVFEKIKPAHLLDLLRRVSIYGNVDQGQDEGGLMGSPMPKNCLSCFGFCKPKPSFEPIREHDEPPSLSIREILSDEESFRNVQELKLSGIEMKPSNIRSLKSVSFSTHWFGISGHLKLPKMTVSNSMRLKLLNLVAYETWLDDDNKRRVSSYLDFMDLLIDTEQDAKDLRTACILRNRLSTDADVANVFNMMGSTYFSRSPDYYSHIKKKIEEHYKRSCAIWLAEFYKNHLRSPWTIVAFILAALVLGLQVVQTIFTVNPKDSKLQTKADAN